MAFEKKNQMSIYVDGDDRATTKALLYYLQAS